MDGTMNGMAYPYAKDGQRYNNRGPTDIQNHQSYHGLVNHQTSYLPAGHLPGNYGHSSYTPSSHVYPQRPIPSTLRSPLQSRSSGVAVVIPTPSPLHIQNQGLPSFPTNFPHPLPPTRPSATVPVHVTKPHPPVHTTHQPPPIDYPSLLLSLAEDYLAAARDRNPPNASIEQAADTASYHKLITTGLACLEVVLKRFKLEPQVEANVRLRYASVLHEETENRLEAEQILSEGIRLCDRYRLIDLKYNMEHLLAQVLFEGSPRASLKFLDGVINDVEAYQHTAWVYGFRFLKVSLLLRTSSHQDILSIFAQLRSISALAERSGDKAILVLASTLEALVQLRDSSSAESIEQAQRALATSRSLQLDSHIACISQIVVLTNMVDLACSLQQSDPSQAITKMQAMQTSLETQNSIWDGGGSLLIPIQSQSTSQVPSGCGIVRQDMQGVLSIVFRWAPWEQIYALGYILSSMAIAHRNTSDGLRSEQMLREGLRYLDKRADTSALAGGIVSMPAPEHNWRQTIKCFFQLHLVFSLCTRTAWPAARNQFQELKATATLNPSQAEILDLLIHYLDGVINQGTGNLDAALSIFQNPRFSLASKSPSSFSPAHLDLAILSTFNSILIIRPSTHTFHHSLPTLLSHLSPHLPRINTSKPLLASYNLILATCSLPPPTIVKTKQYLQSALQAAKTASNNQLTCIALSLMSFKFFKGLVGEQAEKSARASENLARKGMDSLWKS
ncbi:MAG: hypothetical protein Q9222_001535, partial [Ikaeria aurantiellina]